LPSAASVVSFALFKRLLFFFHPVSGLWIGGLIHYHRFAPVAIDV